MNRAFRKASLEAGNEEGRIPPGESMHLAKPYSLVYRVSLQGVGQDTDEEKEFFCRRFSEEFNVSQTLLKKVVDHCPFVLKTNLTWKMAASLARILKPLGALILIEVRENVPTQSLEFQNLMPLHLALEYSSLGKTQSGAWDVVGRVRNITQDPLVDTWVLIQLFDAHEEFLTFEEVPLILNPLPPGEISPFKAVFEQDLSVHRVSIGFKTSSGAALGSTDKRPVPEWKKVRWEDGNEAVFSIDLSKRPPLPEFRKPKEDVRIETSPEEPDSLHSKNEEAPVEQGDPSGGIEEERDKTQGEVSPDGSVTQGDTQPPLPSGAESEGNKGPKRDDGCSDGSLVPSESAPLSSPSCPWVMEFRDSVETYYQEYPDPFIQWYRSRESENRFKNEVHSLLTILAHARFDQMDETTKALENTDRVFQLLAESRISLEEIPVLESSFFFSCDQWRDLFYRAIPKLQQISRNLLGRGKGEAWEIERMIQVIPHMSQKTSRNAVRWVGDLMPTAVAIDFSNRPVLVDRNLYRVASRLGIVDPHFDLCLGRNSTGDIKIQAFAREIFPQDPSKIEAPMAWVGKEEAGGHCLSFDPRCERCLFGKFCQKLYFQFDPSEKGMGRH